MNEACASILVRDTGVGISREVLEKIDRSEYFSTKGTANEKGSGFGLVLVKELLCRHNAELVIESEPGKGSCFTVKFRYCEQE
jgi:signal transduction histidine kinase